MFFAAKDVALNCAPGHHLIDRRTLVTEKNPNDSNNDLKDRLNQRCQCGKISGHSADYRGGDFTYVYLKDGPEFQIEQMRVASENSLRPPMPTMMLPPR